MQSTQFSRRDFLKIGTTATLTTALASTISFRAARALPPPKSKLYEGKKIPSVCPYCAVGCTVIGTVVDGKVVDVAPDLYAPHTEGTLCPKGEASMQLLPQFNPYRLRRPLMRTNPKKGEGEDPGWKEITWEQAWDMIIKKYKEVYTQWKAKKPFPDEKGNYIIEGGRAYDEKGKALSMLNPKALPIFQLSGDYMSNEEAWIGKKKMVLMGSNNCDIQARRCHSTTVAGLADVFGFGGMTNSAPDFANAKVTWQIGSNQAEQHPVAFRFTSKSIEKGGKYIVFDPRYGRSASKAHIFAWFRPGTEAAIFLGMWNYIIKNKRYDQEFLEKRTDAFKKLPTGETVWEALEKHVSGFTPEEVSRITGVPVNKLLKAYDVYTDPRNRPGTIVWCIGSTQHSCGTMIIRIHGQTQLLLGNFGPGGGGNVLRGITNVQGSNDMNHLQQVWLGYRRLPGALGERDKLPGGGEADIRKYQKYKNLVNQGKSPDEIAKELGIAWVGDLRHYASWRLAEKAWGIFIGTYPEDKPDEGVVISDTPVHTGLTTIEYFREMERGRMKMAFIIGMNPVVSVGNANQVIRGLSTPGTFTVVMEVFLSETAHFADVVLPGVSRYESSGSVTNTSRWIQWRHRMQDNTKVVDPYDPQKRKFTEMRSELWFHVEMFRRLRKEGLIELPSEAFAKAKGIDLKELRKLSNGMNVDEPWIKLGPNPDPFDVSKEINSVHRLYWGIVGKGGENNMARRDKKPVDAYDDKWKLYKNWAFSWPDNQRLLYDLKETGGKTGPLGNAFFKPEGRATFWSGFYARRGMGLAGYYEPAETPDRELAKKYPPLVKDHPYGVTGVSYHPGNTPENGLVIGTVEEGYDVILTTFRMVEHQHTGQLTRNVPWLAEMVPEHWIEITPSLAKKLGVKTGDKVRVTSKRGQIVTKAMVTKRVSPLMINGKLREVAAAPWAWGFAGPVSGPIANKLTIDAMDDETGMPETKIALVKIERA